MEIIHLCTDRLQEAPWNSNQMTEEMLSRLRESIRRFGFVENMVVRSLGDGMYEVLSGNQRLKVLKEFGKEAVPCMVVDLDDAHARLLAQALNRIEGTDDLGLKAQSLKLVLERLPKSEVLSLLPESAESLQALSSLGEMDMASHLKAWQQAQSARLRHLTFQLIPDQLEVVEKALEKAMTEVSADYTNPNRRGNALYLLCLDYLKRSELK